MADNSMNTALLVGFYQSVDFSQGDKNGLIIFQENTESSWLREIA